MERHREHGGSGRSITLGEYVAEHLGDRWVVSASEPDLRLGPVTVVAAFDDVQVARGAIRGLEASSPDDGQIGFVTVTPSGAVPEGGVDPEGVVGYTGRGVLRGAVIGILLGGLVGALAGMLMGAAGSVLAMALGGAVLFGAVGGMVAAFARLGGSQAYQDTFVAQPIDRSYVGVKVEDRSRLAETAGALRSAGGRSVTALDESGHSVGS